MRFEILGEISEIETFASGPLSGSSRGCAALMDPVAGGKERGLLEFSYGMALFASPRYTGMKRPVSDARSSR